jgi:hypothetical protein
MRARSPDKQRFEAETGDADLWFLPGPADPEEALGPIGLPAPRLAAPGLADPADWAAAQASLAADLADLAQEVGRLQERLGVMGQGAIARLAASEALALGWWAGDRLTADRLALWMSFRLGATGADGGAMTRLSWVARRLAAAPMRQEGCDAAALLGLAGQDAGFLAEADAALADLAPLHPLVRGAAAFRLWRQLDERPDHLRGLEAAVLGAKIGGGRSLPFLPLAAAGFAALTATGSAERRLAGWVTGAHQAVLAGLLELDRLRRWQDRAAAAVADLSGRTPQLLLGCLARHPMVSAPQAEAETGASRAAVERNLTLLVTRGLVREVTGAGRFRVWAARL